MIVIAAIVMNYLSASALTALASLTRIGKKILDVLALVMSITGLALSIALAISIANNGYAIYMFGGFKPPLGVIYYADTVNTALSLLSSSAAVLSVGVAVLTMEYGVKKYFYPLAFLLLAGAQGFLLTGDLFHLYVCTELVAISSYSLTAVYIDRRNCVRAAMLYGIAGTAITSFLLLSTILIYSSYGTVNIADIALKSINPSTTTPFTGGVFGDIASSSVLALTLMTWVFLFKSGIIPNHFWLPRVYRAAPIASLILFTSTADTLGVYGILRVYQVVFSKDSVIASFRNTMIFLLTVVALASAFFSSLLVARQDKVRGIVAYSTIAQLSLALAGFISSNPKAVAGGLLHIAVNALGDTSVLTAYTVYTKYSGSLSTALSKTLMIIGFLNLFGLLPVVPGFWSKALMVSGFLEEGNLVGVLAVLISTGLCAIGYFRFAIKVLSRGSEEGGSLVKENGKHFVVLALASTLILLVTGLGLGLTLNIRIFNIFTDYVKRSVDAHEYILNILGVAIDRG